jgi:hypothetical protein
MTPEQEITDFGRSRLPMAYGGYQLDGANDDADDFTRYSGRAS